MSETPLPHSPACERNRIPILDRLRFLFSDVRDVLEIGSGTGQHAVHFAAAMPWLDWTCSDRLENLPGLRARLVQANLPNLRGPIEFDVREAWPEATVDAVFSANTAHIMDRDTAQRMLVAVAAHLPEKGRFVLYGPFHYGGRATSDSNEAFDRDLRMRPGGEGIRDIEDIQGIASSHGLRLIADMAMPANNRLLAWEKQAWHSNSD